LTTSSATPPPPEHDVSPVTIEEEMQRSYLDYAMSVIVSRALPDVRDGLKPVHRRILYSMHENGFHWNRPYRKSARIVGDVMGRYHPHGDSAIYDAMVRMAQWFAMRLPLVDGQGNFGSMDGDPPAAMRYTEARLARSAHFLLEDIDRETVDFQPNYDETVHEPVVLPAQFPNLLVNGAGGIAVGMATNIPPHNLGEVIDACCAYIDNPDITIEEVIANHVPAPDFPTGGIILGRTGVMSGFLTGRGSVIIRGKAGIEEIRKDRFAIVVTEMPYQVNKSRMIEIIAEHVRDKKIEGISDLRDESDRNGIRVVVELRRDAEGQVVLNQLYRFTPLQVSFGVNMLALIGGRPEQLNLLQIIAAFIEFREEVIRRRTIYELGKARDRAHVLAGLAVAVANLDEVIALIRAAGSPAEARAALMAKPWPAEDVRPLIELLDEPDRQVVDGNYNLSDEQARAILDLRLHRLTGLERDKIGDDLREIGLRIAEFLEILSSREKLFGIMRAELLAAKEQFATPRRTAIEDSEFEHDLEDLIQREDMVVTVTNTGYVKRVPLSTYRSQRRGGKGRSGMTTRDEDFVAEVFVTTTHTPVLFFSSTGMVYKMKVYKLPVGTPTTRGRPLINLLPLQQGESISTLMPLPEDEESWGDLFIMFSTASGGVRRNRLSDFTNVMSNGKIAMKLDEGDRLVRVRTCTEGDDILLNSRDGKCIRFPVTDVRVFSGRTSTGVRGIRLAKGNEVITMSALTHVDAVSQERDDYLRAVSARRRLATGDYMGREDDSQRDEDTAKRLPEEDFVCMQAAEQFVLTITDDGLGKRSSSYEYRITKRGGQGIDGIDLRRAGKPGARTISAFPVIDNDQIVMVTDGGQLIRVPVDDVSVVGRRTRGVSLFRVAEDERIMSVTRFRDVGDTDEDDDLAEMDVSGVGDGGAETGAPVNDTERTSDQEGDKS